MSRVATQDRLMEDHPLFDGVPRVFGFAAFAEHVGLAASSVRGYYLRDLWRYGNWHLMPKPDVLLLRTPGNPLPGWTQQTAGLWLRTRLGSGFTEHDDPHDRRRGPRSG